MYKVIPWTTDLDLTEFYMHASKKGYENNLSQKTLIDCFNNEKHKQVWILYYNNTAVGSVAAHSFPEMGSNSYRIAARTCVLTHLLPTNTLRTRHQIITHQHVTSQFLIPTCIHWCPPNSNMYITSNDNSAGSQRLVHKIFAPAMEETGQMKRILEMNYRGTNQTVWQLYPDKFLEDLAKYTRWY
jgi:hypothetical protein